MQDYGDAVVAAQKGEHEARYESFVIKRAEFYRKWDGRVHNEYMPTWDRYDFDGRHYRHFDGIGMVRWDNGDPGDE